MVLTFDKPTSPNCLQYFRTIFWPQPILNLVGRNNRTEYCDPKTSLWFAYRDLVFPLLTEDRGWPEDTLFLIFEEDWRLRPDDNTTILASPTADDLADRVEIPTASPRSRPAGSSGWARGTVGELRTLHEADAGARPKASGAAPSNVGGGERREPPASRGPRRAVGCRCGGPLVEA